MTRGSMWPKDPTNGSHEQKGEAHGQPVEEGSQVVHLSGNADDLLLHRRSTAPHEHAEVLQEPQVLEREEEDEGEEQAEEEYFGVGLKASFVGCGEGVVARHPCQRAPQVIGGDGRGHEHGERGEDCDAQEGPPHQLIAHALDSQNGVLVVRDDESAPMHTHPVSISQRRAAGISPD
eukprot:CAMPEP_0174942768 /NCGR_PEP_ID=MMETSP1355-20121228/75060_1 /TAXON_ID=464990 /ORGANISM="Hemiselmis tepida, Strain CCMP443" /LENGTH=176 /DNA_ID=CAMNT_0016189963 /DNA_START=22 /DNA_END=550 /DNA_ORIENTATION=-